MGARKALIEKTHDAIGAVLARYRWSKAALARVPMRQLHHIICSETEMFDPMQSFKQKIMEYLNG